MKDRSTSLRTLSERQLNRALLARQLLLDRRALPLTRAIERIGGLQTQSAPSGYIGLRSRIDGFRRDDLTRALERKRVVQAWMMRSTIHMATTRDFWLFVAGVRTARRRSWMQGFKRTEASARAAAEETRRFLADGPRRRAEIVKTLGFDSATWYGVGLWLDLVRVPPSGTWARPRADLYGLASDWLGDTPEITEDEGIEHLVRRYLGGFGPASAADVSSWTGIATGALAPVVERLSLRRFLDDRGKELLDLPRAPLPDADTPAPVRFVAAWDPILLTHARRTQVLPEGYRSRIFNAKSPHSFHTFIVDGRVAGTWRFDQGRIRLEPFERLSRDDRLAAAAEAEHMGALFVDD